MKKIFFLGAAILFLGCQTMPKGAGLMDQDKGVESLVQSVSASPGIKGKNVGVGDFVNPNGEVDPYSRGVANKLEVELSKAAQKNQFNLISRQNFVQLAEEWKLNLSGAIDSSSVKKVGSLLGLDILITGNLSPAGEAVDIAAKGLDTESGKVLWAERVKVQMEKGTTLPVSPRSEPTREGEIKVELWTEKPVYKIGDSMTLKFKTNQDCYITILDVGTSGKVNILYPNRFSGGNKIIAGKTYSIPGPDDGYAIRVEGMPGIEVVRAIATMTPLSMTQPDFSKEAGVFKQVENPASLTRDLNIVATKTQPASRGEGLIRIEIRE